jgi:glucokinase
MTSMTAPVFSLGFDIGGTHLKACALTQHGEQAAEMTRPSRAMEGREKLLATLWSAMEEMMQQFPNRPVGIASPGIVDVERGCSTNVVTAYPDWGGTSLAALARERLGVSVVVENDGQAAAYAEYCWGAARGADPLVTVTLGTGIGGGLVVNGQLVHGEGNLAGRLGHLPIRDSGPLCGCGNRGCLETLASARALVDRARALGVATPPGGWEDEMAPKHLACAARNGDHTVKQIFSAVGHDLGLGLATLANALAPEAIVIGGGMAAAWDLLQPGVNEALQHHLLMRHLRHLEITQTCLGPWAGAIGAATLAWHHLANHISLSEREKMR